MAGITTKGLTETMKMLEKLDRNTDKIIEDALKEGIGIVTDEVRKQIKGLKTGREEKKDWKEKDDGTSYPSKKAVQGLLDSLGYTPIKMNGTKFDVKAGFDGYNNVITKRYPRGHSNKMMANKIDKGTSFMPAQPFLNRAKKQAQKACHEAIEKKIDQEIKKINK